MFNRPTSTNTTNSNNNNKKKKNNNNINAFLFTSVQCAYFVNQLGPTKMRNIAILNAFKHTYKHTCTYVHINTLIYIQ